MKSAFAILILSVMAASALTIFAPTLRPGQSYELFMTSGLPATNWVDLCALTGTNGCIVSPAGQQPTFFRGQFNSPLNQPLTWETSSTPNTSGYHLYYGTASRTYTQDVDAGTNTFWVFAVTNIAPVGYFAATTYEDYGGNYLESDFSNEVAVTNKLKLVIQ